MVDQVNESNYEITSSASPEVPYYEAAGKPDLPVRLSLLQGRIETLNDFKSLSLAEFVDQIQDIEHTLALIAQSIMDICNSLLLEKHGVEAKSYYDIIDKCERRKILPQKLTQRLSRDLVLVDSGLPEIQASEVLEIHENIGETIRTFQLFHQHVLGLNDAQNA